MPSKDQTLNALSKVNDPELHRSLTDLKMVRNVEVRSRAVEAIIALTVPNCPLKDQIEADVRTAITALGEVDQVVVHMTAMTDEERKALFGELQEGSAVQYNHIQRVVAVMSGKGGVARF